MNSSPKFPLQLGGNESAMKQGSAKEYAKTTFIFYPHYSGMQSNAAKGRYDRNIQDHTIMSERTSSAEPGLDKFAVFPSPLRRTCDENEQIYNLFNAETDSNTELSG